VGGFINDLPRGLEKETTIKKSGGGFFGRAATAIPAAALFISVCRRYTHRRVSDSSTEKEKVDPKQRAQRSRNEQTNRRAKQLRQVLKLIAEAARE